MVFLRGESELEWELEKFWDQILISAKFCLKIDLEIRECGFKKDIKAQTLFFTLAENLSIPFAKKNDQKDEMNEGMKSGLGFCRRKNRYDRRKSGFDRRKR